MGRRVVLVDRRRRVWDDPDCDAGARIAVLPGLPSLEAAAAATTGLRHPAAGVVVSNLAYLASLIALFLLTAAELGERNARWATAFFAAMPTSFFLLAPYSESLFLLLTLLAFLWARRSRWGPTSGAAFLAGLTRPMAIALVPALWLLRRERPTARRLSTFAIAAPSWASSPSWRGGASPAVNRSHRSTRRSTGARRVFAPVTVIADRPSRSWPRSAARDPISPSTARSSRASSRRLCWRCVGSQRLRRVHMDVVGDPLSFAWPSRPFLSVPRFACVLFPLAWTWVLILRTGPRMVVAISLMAALQLALAAVFMNWGWIF
jgi:hypothetical protein